VDRFHFRLENISNAGSSRISAIHQEEPRNRSAVGIIKFALFQAEESIRITSELPLSSSTISLAEDFSRQWQKRRGICRNDVVAA